MQSVTKSEITLILLNEIINTKKEITVKKYLLPLVILLLSGCATISLKDLEPSNNSIKEKMLPLTIGSANEIVRSENKELSSQTACLTIFERELDRNIFSKDKNSWGYIQYTTTYDKKLTSALGWVFTFLNLVTLGLPSLIGVPLYEVNCEYQGQITILNSSQTEIKKYIYNEKEGSGFVGLYYGDKTDPQVKMMKRIIERFKADLSSDVSDINSELKSEGPIKQESSE